MDKEIRMPKAYTSIKHPKNCFIICACLIMNIITAHAQKVPVKFLLNESQNGLKNFTVSSNSDSHPVFVDIDGDGDYDCFSGELNRNGKASIAFFKNDGDNSHPLFKEINNSANPLANVSLPGLTIPTFIDIDNDGDYDCFIADAHSGALRFYKNTGSSTHPQFSMQSAAMNPLSMVTYYASNIAQPAFADIDNDGDYDCLITDLDGQEYYFKNIGSAYKPVFEFKTQNEDPFNFLSSSNVSQASFYDWNKDGLIDLFIGDQYYKNTGTPFTPQFHYNKVEGPQFVNSTNNFQLQWVNFNSDKTITVVTGTSTGNFNFFTAAASYNTIADKSVEVITYPNPSKSEFIVQLKNDVTIKSLIRVTDIQGRIVSTNETYNNLVVLGKELQTGIYSLQVFQNGKMVYNQKLIKQ